MAIGIAGFATAGAFLAYPQGYAKPLILLIEAALTLSIAVALGLLALGAPGQETAAMNAVTLAGLGGCVLIGLGLFGLVAHPHLLRKIVAFNVIGGGVFLLFGAIARRGAAAGVGADPVAAGFGHHRDRRRLLRHGARRRASPSRRQGNWAVPSSRPIPPPTLPTRARIDACAIRLAATRESFLLPAIIILPVAAMLLAFFLGGRERVSDGPRHGAVGIALAGGDRLRRSGGRIEPLVYVIGGWGPPLGVALRADGSRRSCWWRRRSSSRRRDVFALGLFDATEGGAREARALHLLDSLARRSGRRSTASSSAGTCSISMSPWRCSPSPPCRWSVSTDSATTLVAALRYLLFALLGSALYLLGATLSTAPMGRSTSACCRAPPARTRRLGRAGADDGGTACEDGALSAASLAAARACGRAAASQRDALGARGQSLLLSGPAALVRSHARADGRRRGADARGLGAAAIIVGSVLALRQARLKLLIAYSTVAQIGYLFLIFPLAVGAASLGRRRPGSGARCRPSSHAFAKAAMFLSAGLIAKALGHDRIAEFRGLGRIAAPAVLAFGWAACR